MRPRKGGKRGAKVYRVFDADDVDGAAKEFWRVLQKAKKARASEKEKAQAALRAFRSGDMDSMIGGAMILSDLGVL